MGDVLGLGDMVSAGIGAAANTASTVMTNKSNEKNVAATNQTNRDIAAENNAVQIGMNRENNQFSHDEAALAYQRQIEHWQRQAQYDSPLEQLKRFQAAGLNPSVAFSGNLAQAASSTPSVAAAQPHGSGVTPTMPNLIPFHAEAPQFGTDLINAISSLARAKRDTAEGSQINSLTDDLVRKLKADTEGQELTNMITKVYGYTQAEKNLAETTERIALLSQEAKTLATQGNLNDALAKAAEAKEYADRQTGDMHKNEAENWRLKNETYYKELKSKLEVWSSEAQKNRSASNNYDSQADLFREERYNIERLLPSEIELRRAQERLYRSQAKYYGSEVLNNESLRNRIAEEILQIIEQTRGARIANDIRESTKSDIIKLIEYQARQSRQDYHNPFHYVGSALGGSAGAAISLGRD